MHGHTGEICIPLVNFTHQLRTLSKIPATFCTLLSSYALESNDLWNLGAGLATGFILAFSHKKTCENSGVRTMNTKRTAMAFSIRFWAIALAALLIYQFSTEVSADYCKFEKNIDKTLDVSDSEVLTISAAAGDLEVIGIAGTGQAVIHGRVCASKESWLEQSDVTTTTGKRAAIDVDLPSSESGWLSMGKSYVWMDLTIEVPEDLALDVKDSSGDMLLKNIAAVQIKDSSGDIEVVNARGSVSVSDSSGDIEIDNADGDVTIESDSSGDIDANGINGSVLVKSDSSGDIKVSHVSDNVVVERDSSGDISADDVGGDFRVLKDGSGGISSSDVMGEVDIPAKD